MAAKKVAKTQTEASVKKPTKKATKKPASKAKTKKTTVKEPEPEKEVVNEEPVAKKTVKAASKTKKTATKKTAETTAKKTAGTSAKKTTAKATVKKAVAKKDSAEQTSDDKNIPVATTSTRKKKRKTTKKAPKKKTSAKAEVAPVQLSEDIPVLGPFLTKDELCQLIGLSSRRVEQLMFDKTIEKSAGKTVKFETVSTLQRYIKYLTDRANGRKSEARAELEVQKLKAEIALKESQGELHRLRTDIQSGKYIPCEDVKMDFSRQMVVVRNFVMSIPDRIAGQLSGRLKPVEVSELEKALQEDIKAMLRSFLNSAYVEEDVEEISKPTGRKSNAKKQI